MEKVKGLLWIVVMGVMFNLTSCIDSEPLEDPYKQLNADIKAIDDYLEANSIIAIKDPYGIRMVIHQLGTKLPAKTTSTTVDVDYVGKLFSNGSTFDQGNIKTALSSLIDGWKVAFTTLPVGSKATIYVPSPLAYGSQERSGIPRNSILAFYVEFNEAVITTMELQKLGSDTVAIDNYLTSKSIQATKDTTGIRYVMTQEGEGATPTWYSKCKLKFNYKLLTDDTKSVATLTREPSDYFYSRPVDYTNGLKVGIQKMKKGSKATFYIPSGLGFGPTNVTENGNIIIPANSNLIVEVELTDIVAP